MPANRIGSFALVAAALILSSIFESASSQAALFKVETASPTTASQFVEATASARRHLETAYRIFERQDYQALKSFVRTAFAPQSMPDETETIASIAQSVRLAGGLTRFDVRQEGKETLGYYRSKLTGRFGVIVLTVEPKAPFRITSFEVSRARMPKGIQVSAPSPDERVRLEEITAYARKLEAAGLFSGAIAIARNDQLIYSRAVGFAERNFAVKIRPDTRFLVGSIDKPFTAVAIAQLVEQAKISYDDPLSKYIDYPSPEFAKHIKIKHLLSHTSGLGDYTDKKYFANLQHLTGVQAYLSILDHRPPAFGPGTGWSYSNLGYLLLGRVVEIASGQDYYDYIRDRVFAPAGMTNSLQPFLNRPIERAAVPYEDFYEAGKFVTKVRGYVLPFPERGAPDGATLSTTGDLVKFYAALRGGKLVSPSTYRLMTSAKTALASPNYGYGLFVTKAEAANRDVVGHAGDAPGVCAESALIRDIGVPYTVVVLANQPTTCKAVFQTILAQYSTLPTRLAKPVGR